MLVPPWVMLLSLLGKVITRARLLLLRRAKNQANSSPKNATYLSKMCINAESIMSIKRGMPSLNMTKHTGMGHGMGSSVGIPGFPDVLKFGERSI